MRKVRTYEINYVIRPNIEEEAKAKLVEQYNDILTNNGSEIVESKDWSKRRLAYEINDFREGIYHVITVKAEDPKGINEFDRVVKISPDVLRHIIVRLDEE